MHHPRFLVGRHAGRRLAVFGVAAAFAGLTTAACGSNATNSSNTLAAGQLSPGAVGNGSGHGSGSTIPLAKQNSITALFTALSSFQSCLKGLGVTFVGIPGSGDPNAPQNNPQYIQNLTTCAAQSQILQALKTAQTAQDNLTLAQIKTENKQYLKWRTCMIGKGWTIPTPTPNAKGLLFSFGGAGGAGAGGAGNTGAGAAGGAGGVGGFVPPPGQNIISSNDLQDCASQVLG